MKKFLIIITLIFLILGNVYYLKKPLDWGYFVKLYIKELLAKDYSPNPPSPLFTIQMNSIANTRWCFVGDTGVDEDSNSQVSKLLLKKAGACQRIYHLGDIVYPTGIKSTDDPRLKQNFLKQHAPFQVPYYLILGNHEYMSLKLKPWLELAKQTNHLNFPYYYYGHRVDGLCLVAFDTTPFYRGKRHQPRPKSQIKWLKKIISKELKYCKFKIFIAHHPYDTPNKKRKPPLKKYKKTLRKLYEKYILGNFDLIITGHDHILSYVGNFKGTDHWISGAGGKFTSKNNKNMDLINYVGHKGPGVLYFDITNNKPFEAKMSLMVLEGKNLDQIRVAFEKVYNSK